MKNTLFLSAVVLIGCGGDDPASTTPPTDSGDFAEVITTRPDDGPDTNPADTSTGDTATGETATDTGGDTAKGETATETGTDTGADTGGVTTITGSGTSWSPSTVTIKVGQKVRWVIGSGFHTVTSGAGCVADNKFCNPSDMSCATAPTMTTGASYERTFTTAGEFPFFCAPHCAVGMTGKVTVVP